MTEAAKPPAVPAERPTTPVEKIFQERAEVVRLGPVRYHPRIGPLYTSKQARQELEQLAASKKLRLVEYTTAYDYINQNNVVYGWGIPK